MELDTVCCMCGRLDEDGAHLYLKCNEVKAIWIELNLEHIRGSLAETSTAREMMESILKLEPRTQLKTILLLWLWWSERNEYREEGRRRTAVEIIYVTEALSDRFQAKQADALLRIIDRSKAGNDRSKESSK